MLRPPPSSTHSGWIKPGTCIFNQEKKKNSSSSPCVFSPSESWNSEQPSSCRRFCCSSVCLVRRQGIVLRWVPFEFACSSQVQSKPASQTVLASQTTSAVDNLAPWIHKEERQHGTARCACEKETLERNMRIRGTALHCTDHKLQDPRTAWLSWSHGSWPQVQPWSYCSRIWGPCTIRPQSSTHVGRRRFAGCYSAHVMN